MKAKRETTHFPRRSIFRRAAAPRADALTWPRDLAGRCARATAIGSGCLLVENYRRILELTEDRVRLSTAEGALTVTGRGLSLCEARPGALMVRGEICRVELPGEGGGGPS